ncbi:hypothetical protein HYV85_03530 [Candidatus Woesearchaeota archaeon]|nr:hypothetical protein [Candidatus Woesearchaeota archaeon]
MAKAMSMSRAGDNSLQSIGSWAFLLGVFVAIIAGALLPDKSTTPTVTSFLVLLGTIVGLLNVTTKETNSFLLASVSLVLVTALGGSVVSGVVSVGQYLGSMLDSILVFVVPATIVVALKSIFALAERK